MKVRDGAAVHDLAALQIVRGQNFLVQWLGKDITSVTARSHHEMLLLLPDAGAQVRIGGTTHELPARSVCVLPGGGAEVHLSAGNGAALVASSRLDLPVNTAVNHSAYVEPDPRIIASDQGYRRRQGAGGVHVIEVDKIAAPADKPRLKMFQTDTLSINWVEYFEARDRSQLSPHSHGSFEQGSLAMAGNFIHHLRVNWGPDANDWRDDQHLVAGSPSMITVPVHLIHTTEGVGGGRHLLIDVFSPPREDFIERGWVANAGDYTRERSA